MDKPKQHPEKLAEKLLLIRKELGLSQNELIKELGFEGELIQSHISAYENKKHNRIPPVGVILQYARLSGVSMEELVDDKLTVDH